MENKYSELSKLDVSKKVDKKGRFSYLSWAFAWDEFAKVYPDATYKIIKNELNLPYFNSDAGAMVFTEVTAGGLTHEMWLPVMDNKNNALKQFTMMDVNKAVMRCLVKNLSMFGLGLYIYAGEDLPEQTIEMITEQQHQELRVEIQNKNLDYMAVCQNWNMKNLTELQANSIVKFKEWLGNQ